MPHKPIYEISLECKDCAVKTEFCKYVDRRKNAANSLKKYTPFCFEEIITIVPQRYLI